MMRNYFRPSTYRDGITGLHRGAHFFAKNKSALTLRVGIPLALAAVSAFGWHISSASKPAPAVNATHEELTPQKADVPQVGETDATNSIDTSLEVTQQEPAQPTLEATLNVNSEPVPIPESGSVHKVIQNDTNTMTVDVTVDSQTSGSSQSSASMNVEINSNSRLESEVGSEEEP